MTHTRLRLVAFLVLLLASIGGASSNLVQPASAASKVALQSSIPTGATLSGSVTWLVKTSGSGISRIDFSIDGVKRWTEGYAPYQFNSDPNGRLDTTTLADGTHTLLATVFNSSGVTLARVSVGVTVKNAVTPPPPPPAPAPVTVTSSIAAGATIRGSLPWVATTTGLGIARIDFSIDGTTRWTDQTAPYYFNGDPSGTLDTTTLANGSHTLLAAAFDANGVELARVSSTVTVGNTPPPLASTWARYGTANGWRLPFRSTADQDFEIGQDVALGARYVRIGPSDARRRSSPTPCTPPTAWAPGIASSPSP